MTECVDYVNGISNIVLFGMVSCSIITHSSPNGCVCCRLIWYGIFSNSRIVTAADHDVVITFEDHTTQRDSRFLAVFSSTNS